MTDGPVRCTVCGVAVNGAALLALRGDLSCAGHDESVACAFCEHRARHRPVTWRDVGGGLLRCELCAHDAVELQHQVAPVLGRVRESLARRGLTLREPAKVRLVPPHTLLRLGHGRGHALGATTIGYQRDGPGKVTDVRIAAGLPFDLFYGVAAHEFGHAWLALRRRERLPAEIAEGFSESLAYGVLRDLGSPLADRIRERMMINPDPVYGVGFRMVRDEILRFGLSAVVDSLVRVGELPGRLLA